MQAQQMPVVQAVTVQGVPLGSQGAARRETEVTGLR